MLDKPDKMKYHRLDIRTDNSADTYNKISNLLGWTPIQRDNDKTSNDRYSIWSHSVDIGDDEPYFDFVNIFLDRLEPNFTELQKLAVTKDDITIWLLHEYNQQCGMEFHPKEMKRLGDNGIVLCIDCWQTGEEKSTTA